LDNVIVDVTTYNSPSPKNARTHPAAGKYTNPTTIATIEIPNDKTACT
jgi:hypothetical protein